MAFPGESKTSITLLMRVARFPPDEEAWQKFVERYGPAIAGWCYAQGLQEADAEDVTQTVLTGLTVRLRRFVYDPNKSFRGLLRKITHDAVCDAIDELPRAGFTGASSVLHALMNQEARTDLAQRLEAEFDLELLDAAMANVRERVERQTWEAYRLTAHEGLSGADAAARLGMRIGTVFQAKSSVMSMLKDEIHRLEESECAAKMV